VFSNGKTIDLGLIKLVEEGNDTDCGTDYVENLSYKDAKKEVLDHFSQNYLHDMFKETKGNISEASRISGLERASIQKIVKRLGIDMSNYRE